MPELNLERPIIFFDLETTGTNILRDRIVLHINTLSASINHTF